jgi:general secretion pathway protein F
MRFNYRAVGADGKTQAGELEATSRKHALRELTARNLLPIEVTTTGFDEDAVLTGRLPAVSQRELLTALFELASMLMAGVAVAEAVESQSKSAAHPAIRKAFASMLKSLRQGGAFSVALEESGLKVPPFIVFLVRAGEMTGNVGPAMQDACEQLEYALQVRADARNALIYPSILVVSGILAVVMMFVFVVPSFTNLLEQGADLPWLAWAVLTAGKWANENTVLLLLGLVGLVAAPLALLRLQAVRTRALELLETMPMVGDWLVHADIAAWARMLSSMLRNRVELTASLALASEVVRSPGRRHRLERAAKAVRQGAALSQALADNNCLNETGYNLVRVGEKTGSLDPMLHSLSEIYTRQGNQRMKKVLMLIEPIAILLIGGAIGTLIIAVILAITSANDFAF